MKSKKSWTTYYSDLACSHCGQSFDIHQLQTFCQVCNTPLAAAYDLKTARAQLDRDAVARRPRGMWRWRELLPVSVPEKLVTLGEGDAPLLDTPRLAASLGMQQVYVKDESLNPTGTFKARGMAAAISMANQLGVERVIIPTAGNAGGAMAAYAARAGMQAAVYMPSDTPQANMQECRAMGAELILVDGLISDAARLVGVRAGEEGWFDLSTFKEPFRLEGKKVMGYEIAESLGWKLPNWIFYPTGGGTGLVGLWKAFAELAELGWLEDDARPRLVAVQAEGCAPVVRAFETGAGVCEFWQGAQTDASGLRVPKSFADRMILSALRASRGTALAVSEQAIADARAELAQCEGLYVAPEGAATLAGLRKLLRSGVVNSSESVVLLNTGAGLKYL